jgi:dienelactone hydrolase
LTRAQLLAGNREGATSATIAGELSIPFVAAARMPAVLLLHGDAGAIANQVVWREELNALGIAVFTLDSFSGRGAVATSASFATMPDSIGGLARIVDAERALALLAKHPRIDPARIAVMGFSSGGRTVLAAAQSRFAAAFGTPGLRFAAYVALYPDCNARLVGDTKSEPGPQRIFIGQDDVLTSAAACARYAERLRAAGADIATTSFAGAHHGFDNVSNPDMIRVADVPTGAACDLEETAAGELVNVDTGHALTLADKCIGKGLIAGYDPAADAATKVAVKALLVERFGLRP